ncbi:1-acyl-sn-glycerol-3-phosphate acyltransferase epsilon [Pelobates cultripes]|uniref:1-acyl-sn-glycerol-3-phosphate acyltransferase epsilon, partial n=1 Tax=Pelobates cultripes TaxID=61616 RepID=A0AAD1RD68_PELCU|nr:1-acyl-sn-glycerol-3-phosphate acyltransferase epsilon [Pelobates cultripes]
MQSVDNTGGIPEDMSGTRYNPDIPKVIVDSQAFAMKEGLPVLKHVLTPRVKATHVAIDAMQNHLDAVYDVTVAYEGTTNQEGQRKEAPSMTGIPYINACRHTDWCDQIWPNPYDEQFLTQNPESFTASKVAWYHTSLAELKQY